jgi:hypothetical protein
MAIGALTELKEKRVLAAEEERQKRLEDRKFKMQQKLQTQRDDAAALRNEYTVNARLQVARDKAEAEKAKNDKAAALKFHEDHSDFDFFRGTGVKLPSRFLLDKKGKFNTGMGFLSRFNAAFNFVDNHLKETYSSNSELMQKNYNRLDEWLLKKIPEIMSKTEVMLNKYNSAGEVIGQQGYHVESGMGSVYQYLNTHKDAKMRGLLDGIRDSVPLPPLSNDAKRMIKENPSIDWSKFGSVETNALVASARIYGGVAELRRTGMVGALGGEHKDIQNSAKSLAESTDSPFKYNSKNPFKTLHAIATASIFANGRGKSREKVSGGGVSKLITHKYKDRNKEINDGLKKHNENMSLLSSIVDIRTLSEQMDQAEAPQLNFLRDVTEKLHGFVAALGIADKAKKISFEKGISDEMDATFRDATNGGLTGKITEGLQDGANKRIKAWSDSLDGKTNLTDPERHERYLKYVQYEALKIQLVYKIAKMVQGGSGGQAVSNADFQVVLQSFQSGTIGNLEAEDNIFKMLQGMTEREYLHSYINTQKSLLEGASPTQNAARYYLEQHRQYNTSMSNRASFAETQEAATMNFKKAQAEYEAKRQAKLKEVTQRVTGQSGS